jgi:hypothetical protein
LIIGLWTPIAGALVVVEQIVFLWLGTRDPWIHVLLGTFAGALALVGPGAWSLDARLFGWKRIDLPDRRNRSLDNSERAFGPKAPSAGLRARSLPAGWQPPARWHLRRRRRRSIEAFRALLAARRLHDTSDEEIRPWQN